MAEFHALLPRDKAKTIGGIYARYSSRFQHSIGDQVRALFEAALKQGIFISRSHIFYDMAVRGYKEQRPGLNRLRAVLADRSIQVFLVFTTNRLFRKTYKALQFVEEEVVERGIRCLFVKSGVDSADEKRWRMLLQIHAMTDEFVVGMYADNVRAAHEGLFDQQLVWGTLSFGYRGEPIPGAFTKRNRPRCRVVIDTETASWVQRIFVWYVRGQLSLDEIARRLNADPSIPLGPKSVSGQWTHQAVRGVLKNGRYRGARDYGATQNVWQSKKDYSRQIPRPEPLRSAQVEELRIVEDELWYGAQKRLAAESKANAGRKPKDGDRRSRPRLLNGLFYCPQHDQSLYVGGAHGKYLFCRACQCVHAETRPLYSQLLRALALRLTCRKLAALIQEDEELVQRVVIACQQQAGQLQQADPATLESLRKQEERLSKQIRFLMQNAGETEADQREAAEQLKLLRCQRAEVAAEISRHETRDQRQILVPTEMEIRALIRNLGELLTAAAQGESVVDFRSAREALVLLTGGRIELSQQGERQARRGWLQGRFRVRLLSSLVEKALNEPCTMEDSGREVVIDYREAPEEDPDVERAKALADEGLMYSQIAARLGCARNWVTELLRRWHEARGLPVPDGRRRRATLSRKQAQTPRYQLVAEEAKRLWDAGLADVQIAERLGCSPPTVTAAIDAWHTERGLPTPTHTDRRSGLVDRMQQRYQEGAMIKTIAQEVGMCSRSVTLLLGKRFAVLGLPMPDGRTRR